MRQLMYTTPGITEPDLSVEPLGTEGEMTPGPDDENPFENARELREQVKFEQRQRAFYDKRLTQTVPNPQNPDLPPALLETEPTKGDDPYVFDDVEEEVESLRLPGMGKTPDTELRFETGEMFQF